MVEAPHHPNMTTLRGIPDFQIHPYPLKVVGDKSPNFLGQIPNRYHTLLGQSQNVDSHTSHSNM